VEQATRLFIYGHSRVGCATTTNPDGYAGLTSQAIVMIFIMLDLSLYMGAKEQRPAPSHFTERRLCKLSLKTVRNLFISAFVAIILFHIFAVPLVFSMTDFAVLWNYRHIFKETNYDLSPIYIQFLYPHPGSTISPNDSMTGEFTEEPGPISRTITRFIHLRSSWKVYIWTIIILTIPAALYLVM
jgi:hypothetical protein